MSIVSGLGSVGTMVAGAATVGVVMVGGIMVMERMRDDPVTGDSPIAAAAPAVPEGAGQVDANVEAPQDSAAEPAIATVAPSFDVVRVDAEGGALVAGRALANATVLVLIDGAEAHRTRADGAGSFVAIFTVPLVAYPRIVSLSQLGDDGTVVPSKASVILAPSVIAGPPDAIVSAAPAGPVPAALDETLPLAEPSPERAPAEDPVAPDLIAGLDLPVAEIPAQEGESAARPDIIAGISPEPEAALPPTGSPAPELASDPIVPSQRVSAAAQSDPEATPRIEVDAPVAIASAEEAPATGPEPVIAQAEPEIAPVAESVTEAATALKAIAPATPEPETIAVVDDTTPEVDAAVEVSVATTTLSTAAIPDPVTAETDVPPAELATALQAPVSETTPDAELAAAPEALEAETVEAVSVDPVAVENPGVAFAAPDPEPVVRTQGSPTPEPIAPEVSDVEVASDTPPLAPLQDSTSEAPRLSGGDDKPLTPAEPSAPAVLLADDSGIRVLQTSGTAPEVRSVAIDTITYTAEGDVSLGGRGAGQGFVRVYLNNRPIQTTEIAADGQWRTPLPEVDTGVYTLRVDELDESGTVTSRVETPFKREEPTVLAALDTRSDDSKETPIAVLTVQPGNTLWGIATENYGDGMLYVRVFEANKDRIRNPNLIYPGQVFAIPE